MPINSQINGRIWRQLRFFQAPSGAGDGARLRRVRIVEESLAPGARVAEVARRYEVHPNLLHLWRRKARTGMLSVVADAGSRFVPVAIATGNGAAAVAAGGAGLVPVVEVVLRNGRVLRLPEGVSPARAVALADALERP